LLIFFIVPMTIKGPHSKTLQEIAKEVSEKADKAKKGKDEQHNKNFQVVQFLPSFLLGPLMGIISYVTLNLGWDIPIVGAKGKMYAPVVLTNVGSLGLTAGFAPVPPTRACLLACMGMIMDKPWVVDGEIKIRKIMTVVYTFDHRIGDGAITVKPLKLFKKMIENPAIMEEMKFEGAKMTNPELFDEKKNN